MKLSPYVGVDAGNDGGIAQLHSGLSVVTRKRSIGPGFAVIPAWLSLLAGAMLVPHLAAAAALDIDQVSGAAYASALYDVLPMSSQQNVKSLAAWDAIGRKSNTAVDIVPAQPDGFRFEQDRATAWIGLEQDMLGANTTLRAFAQLSGYYFDDGGVNFARNEIHVHNIISIKNNSAHEAEFRFIQTTHGTLVSGGLSNIVAASAQEVLTYAADSKFHDIWSGAATVYAANATPTVTVSDLWKNVIFPVSKSVAGFADPFQGIDIHLLKVSPVLLLDPNKEHILDVDFRGTYEVTSNSGSGYLSFAEADFSGTGDLIYSAIDPATGLPDTEVTITIQSAPVPAPPSSWMMLMGMLGLMGHARHRLVRLRRA